MSPALMDAQMLCRQGWSLAWYFYIVVSSQKSLTPPSDRKWNEYNHLRKKKTILSCM